MRKIWIFVLLTFVLVSFPLKANLLQEFDIAWDGKLTERISYNHGLDEWQNLVIAGLRFNCDYGYNFRVSLNPELTYETWFIDKGEVDIELREGYLDLYLDQLDLRFGKQLVNWGSAYKLNPTDKVNPMDLTAADPTASDRGVVAIKGEYYLDQNTIFTGIAVGQFVPTILPENLQKVQSDLLINGIYEQILAYVHDPITAGMLMNNLTVQTIEPTIQGAGDLEYGCKITRRNLLGSDVSLSFFRGYEDIPTLHSDLAQVIPSLLSGNPTQIDFTYQRSSSMGLDLIGEIQGIGYWSETSFSMNESKEKLLETVLGGDYTFRNNLYTVLQYYHRNPLEEEKEAENYIMLHAQLPVRQIHQLTTTLMCDLGEGAIVLNPELKLSLYDNLSMQIGTFYTSGLGDNSTSLLSTYGNTQTYLGISYGF